jgi:hypothetical protein
VKEEIERLRLAKAELEEKAKKEREETLKLLNR